MWRGLLSPPAPTSFPVKIGRHSWYGNCICPALGIPAMLHKDARIDGSLRLLQFRDGVEREGVHVLLPHEGVGHFAVPAREWYHTLFSPERRCSCSGRSSTLDRAWNTVGNAPRWRAPANRGGTRHPPLPLPELRNGFRKQPPRLKLRFSAVGLTGDFWKLPDWEAASRSTLSGSGAHPIKLIYVSL